MLRWKSLIVFLFATLFIGCSNKQIAEVHVHECAPMPIGRASACACVLDGKAYIFSGRDANGHFLNDLWSYDPQTDTWVNLGAAPMNPRVNATITAYNGKLYAGMGYSAPKAYNDTAYQRDFWEYTPATGTWKRLADFPNACTVAPLSFVISDAIYAIYGFGYSFTRDICRYDVASDSWSTMPDNVQRPKRNFGGRGAWLNGLYYYGTGFATFSMTQWYVTDITGDRWDKCASILGKGRQFCACAASNNYVYLFGGRYFAGDLTGGEVFDTFMRYSPDKDKWYWCGHMPGGRAENQIAFSIDGKVYAGLGENENGQIINSLYCFEE